MQDTEDKIRVGISIGDLNGIGGEIILKTFEDSRMLDFCTPVIFASNKTISFLKNQFNLNLTFHGIPNASQAIHNKINVVNVWKESPDIEFGKATEVGGKYAIRSLKAAVESLNEPIEALVMNAGGMGGKNPGHKNGDGVIQMFAVNVLGHVVLLDELLRANKLTKVALYAGSEAARGVAMMGMKRPDLKTSSVDEFASIADGSFFGDKVEPTVAYGPVKYTAAMWMASVARKHPDIRFVTMSPGGTTGTDVLNDMPPLMKFMYKNVVMRLMPLFGLMHGLEVGAKRYVDGLNDESYKSGVFYGSKKNVTGPLVDQGTLFADLKNEAFQDNANEAIHRVIN